MRKFMLIGGDGFILGMYCTNVCVHSHSFLLCADSQKSDSLVKEEPQGNWRQSTNSRDVVASSLSFSCPAAKVPQRACSQVTLINVSWSIGSADNWSLSVYKGLLIVLELLVILLRLTFSKRLLLGQGEIHDSKNKIRTVHFPAVLQKN